MSVPFLLQCYRSDIKGNKNSSYTITREFNETGTDHWNYGAGWILFIGAAPQKRLRGPWSGETGRHRRSGSPAAPHSPSERSDPVPRCLAGKLPKHLSCV